MHADTIVSEFTHQAATFNASPVMSSAETLQTLVDLIPSAEDQRWLEVACGPGLISRALARHVASVRGIDITEAMVELARREARAAGLKNAEFSLGDATALPFDDASFHGAVTRFSLHHIPVPGRCVAEMARVVRPGGWVVLGDHVTDPDQEAAAWHQEIERLRDPSHWACLTPKQLRSLAERADLTLAEERLIPVSLDYEEWLTRGSGGPTMRELVGRALAERPEGCDAFRPGRDPSGKPTLHLRYWLSLWRR